MDVVASDGSDALFFAAREGLTEAARVLLRHGVDTTRSDRYGRSGIH